MINGCNIFLSKTGKHLQLCGQAHYRATRKNLESRTQLDEPDECASGSDPLLLYKSLHLLSFPLVRILCALGDESPKKLSTCSWSGTFGISVSSAEEVSHQPIQNSVAFSFEVTGKTPGLLSRNNFVKKFLSASAIAIKPWQDATRSSLCSGLMECGTKRAHNFLLPKSSFRIRRTSLGDVQRFCYHTRCDSTVIFDQISNSSNVTSVRIDFGQSNLSSYSSSYLPSRNREYHLKTFDRFRAFRTNTGVPVADRPALKQNFKATPCSFPPSMTYKEN